jgi:hypothetical protein
MQQTAADTLRICDSVRGQLRNAQRTVEFSLLQIQRSKTSIQDSLGRLIACEIVLGICPKHPEYRLLVSPDPTTVR